MLLDSAYVGKPVTSHLQSQNINAVVVPKKMSNSKPSHVLDPDAKKLIKKRWKIEQIIGALRSFRAINLKFNKLIANYRLLLSFAILIHNCAVLFK